MCRRRTVSSGVTPDSAANYFTSAIGRCCRSGMIMTTLLLRWRDHALVFCSDRYYARVLDIPDVRPGWRTQLAREYAA